MPDPIPQDQAPAGAAEMTSGAALAADLLQLPAAPSPAAQVAPAAPGVDQPAPPAGELDSLRRPFDAQKFRPEKDILGRWKNLRGGRKPGVTNAPPAAPAAAPRVSFVPDPPPSPSPGETPAANAAESTPAAAPVPRSTYERSAEIYLRAGYRTADKIFDGKGEWKPDSDAEHNGLREDLVECLQVYNAPVLPAWARFGLGLLNFILTRVDRPNTVKTARFYWSKGKASPEKKVDPAAPPAQPAPAAQYVNPLEIALR